MTTAKAYLEAANAEVPRIPGGDAIAKHGSSTVFVDVRDSAAIAESGTIKGATRIPRGFLEFAADPEMKFHNPVMQRGRRADGRRLTFCSKM